MCKNWDLYGVLKVRFGFGAFVVGRLLYITHVSYGWSTRMNLQQFLVLLRICLLGQYHIADFGRLRGGLCGVGWPEPLENAPSQPLPRLNAKPKPCRYLLALLVS